MSMKKVAPDAGAHGQPQLVVGVVVFVGLETEEDDPSAMVQNRPRFSCARLFSAAPSAPR